MIERVRENLLSRFLIYQPRLAPQPTSIILYGIVDEANKIKQYSQAKSRSG